MSDESKELINIRCMVDFHAPDKYIASACSTFNFKQDPHQPYITAYVDTLEGAMRALEAAYKALGYSIDWVYIGGEPEEYYESAEVSQEG